jgi:Right handed beta helix region
MPLSLGSTGTIRCGLAAASLFLCAICLDARAGVWRVNNERTGDAPTIQAAIELAHADTSAPLDTVLVAPGRYTWTNQGSGDEFGLIRFWKQSGDDIHLVSEGGPRVTILDAEHFGRVFFANGDNLAGDPVEFLIDGFTFMNGNAPRMPNRPEREGGAMAMHLVTTRIRNCAFRNNRAEYGGAVWLGGVGSHHFEDCRFEGNSAVIARPGVGPLGGGICVLNSTEKTTFERCAFVNNRTAYRGGGGLVYNATVDFVDCVFTQNSSTHAELGNGTALYILDVQRVNLERVLIRGNDTSNGPALLIREINKPSMKVTVNHSVIAYNYPGTPVRVTGDADFNCTNIFGHFGGDWPGSLANQLEEDGNRSVDPLFCESATDSRWVRIDSPLLADNNDCGTPLGWVMAACGHFLHSFGAKWQAGGAVVTLEVDVSPNGSEGFTLERVSGAGESATLAEGWGAQGGTVRYVDTEAPLEGATYRLLDDGRVELARSLLRLRVPLRAGVTLLGAFPNPFNPQTEVFWQQSSDGPARVCLYDVQGREVALLHDGPALEGENSVLWLGVDGKGNPVGSGVYFIEVEGGGTVDRGKLALVR